MSLSKQLFALLSAIFIVIFSVNLLISVNNIRDFLETESEIHAQDTATSLGLALSPHLASKDDPIIETMMNAIFDRGYYQEIKLTDPEQQDWFKLTNNQQLKSVPEWFKQLLPMKTATAKTEINSGWTIAGELTVTINPGNGYLKLYKQARISFFYSLLALAIAFALLALTLRFTLLPLKKIETLANAIGEGDFTTIKTLPWTTEVKNVAIAMNTMSKKISDVFSGLNQKLEHSRLAVQFDPLTGLNNDSIFKTNLKQLLADYAEGYVFLIKIDDLGSLSNKLGNEKTDQFLIDFANSLKEFSARFEHISAYRLYGAEFALIYKTNSLEKIEVLINSLKQSFTDLGNQYQIQDVAHIGISAFDRLSTRKNILASSQEALEQAKQIGSNSYFIQLATDQAKDLITWKNLVEQIVDEKTYQVKFVNQAQNLKEPQDHALVMEEAFTTVIDDNQQPLATGTFISIAEKYDKVVELDQGVTARVIKHIKQNNIKHPITINLSITTVQSGHFRSWLSGAIKNHAQIARQIVFSVSAYSVITRLLIFSEFINYIHGLGAKVILKRYEPQLVSLDEIKNLKLDYLRLAKDLTTDINNDSEKILLITAIKELGDLLDIKILAENISTEQDLISLKKIGVYGASRQPI